MTGFFTFILDILFISSIVAANAFLFFLLGDNAKFKIEKSKLMMGMKVVLILIILAVLYDPAKYYGSVVGGPILVLLILLGNRFMLKGLSTMGVSKEEILHSVYFKYMVPGSILVVTILLFVHFFVFPPINPLPAPAHP